MANRPPQVIRLSIWLAVILLRLARLLGRALRAVHDALAAAPLSLLVLASLAWACVGITRNTFSWLLVIASALSIAMVLAYVFKLFVYVVVARRKIVLGDLHGDAAQLRTATDALIREALRATRLLREGRTAGRPFVTSEGIEKAAAYADILADEQFDPAVYAAGRDAVLEVWKIKLPAGLFLALGNSLARGPRLHLTVTETAGRLDLAARLARHTRPQAWHFSERTDGDGDAAARRLGEALAERLVAHIALGEAFPWPAGGHFLRGLTAFESSFTSPNDQVNQLRAAEAALLAVIETAPSDVAYHNLGVIYTELERLTSATADPEPFGENRVPAVSRAAETAFLRALGENPVRAATLYALAMSHWLMLNSEGGEPLRTSSESEAARYQEQMLMLLARARSLGDSSEKGKALGLRAVVLWDRAHLSDARRDAFGAFAYSWRALAKSELRHSRSPRRSGSPQAVETARRASALSLANLAGILYQSTLGLPPTYRTSSARAARAVARLAEKVSPQDPRHAYLLGSIEANVGQKPERSLAAYSRAVALAPGDIDMWAGLAWGAAVVGAEHELDVATRQILDRPSLSGDAMDGLADALSVADHPDADRVTELADLLRFLDDAQLAGDRDSVQDVLASYMFLGKDLKLAHTALAAGKMALASDDPERAETQIKLALVKFTRARPGEVQVHGVRALLARAYREQGELRDALVEAQRAVEVDPLSWFERYELAEVHLARGALQEGCVQLQRARSLAPGREWVNQRLGVAYFLRAQDASDASQYKAHLHAAAEALESALQVEEARGARYGAATQLWLGRVRARQGDFQSASTHFVLARADDALDIVACWRLGEAALAAQRYQAAEASFADAAQLVTQHPDRDGEEGQLLGPLGDKHSLPELGIWIDSGWSTSEAARGGDLDAAWRRVDKTRAGLKRVRDERRKQLGAIIHEAEGRLFLASRDFTEAGHCFRAAIRDYPDAEVCLHLAISLIALSEESGGSSLRALLKQAVDALDSSEALDVAGRLSQERDVARTQVARLHQAAM